MTHEFGLPKAQQLEVAPSTLRITPDNVIHDARNETSLSLEESLRFCGGLGKICANNAVLAPLTHNPVMTRHGQGVRIAVEFTEGNWPTFIDQLKQAMKAHFKDRPWLADTEKLLDDHVEMQVSKLSGKARTVQLDFSPWLAREIQYTFAPAIPVPQASGIRR